MDIKNILDALTADYGSIEVIAEYLGYNIGKNPVNPQSDWVMLFSDKIPDKSQAIIALKPVCDFDIESSTVFVRTLYKKVLELRQEISTSFFVEIVGFVGNKRMVFFNLRGGNRDERLDINLETSNKVLYQNNFNKLKNSNIEVVEDEFGFGYEIIGLEDVFKRELTKHFLSVVALYRKKLSEYITGSSLREEFIDLVDDKTKFYIRNSNLTSLVEEKSYTAVLSNVVDTILLRQLMRRFLEGYYGPDSFEVNGIALGVGSGTMEEAIKETVNVAFHMGDETQFQKLNKKKTPILNFEKVSLFDDEELSAINKIEFKELKKTSKEIIRELTDKATQQFRTVYAGDLFAGSIGLVADKIELKIAEKAPDLLTRFWMDTSSDNYSFRYEDLPPEALEKQYENAMSQNVQIKIVDGIPVVFYGEDMQEQKNKGAYYTDNRFVSYMVQQTVEKEFNERLERIKVSIEEENNPKIENNIQYLLDLKVADLTAGGGSFLRGAFLLLASKHSVLSSFNLSNKLKEKYPMFNNNDEGILEWEEHILNNMIYGIDIDYKAITISSLTLTLSSLQHRPKNKQLPRLIGRTLIHQNSLINSVPFHSREKIFSIYQSDIRELLKLKQTDFEKFEKKRLRLQQELSKYVSPVLGDEVKMLHVEALEINIPEVFFNPDGTMKENAGFDVIIGNPPWEASKPKSDEFYSTYDSSFPSLKRKALKNVRVQELHGKFPKLEEKWKEYTNRYAVSSKIFLSDDHYRYQSWKVEGRKTGGDINLYKLCLERADQLSFKNSKISLLLPDNFATDLGSTGIRHLVFDNYSLQEFLSFENKKLLFPSIHAESKFAVTTFYKKKNDNQYFKAFFYKHNIEDLTNEDIKLIYPFTLVIDSEPEKYSLFEANSEVTFNLYKNIKTTYPPLVESKAFELRRDFDRTNDTSYFVNKGQGEIPLYEGKLIDQFQLKMHNNNIIVDDARLIQEYSPEMVKEVEVVKRIGQEYKEWRIGIRAVSNTNNYRTLISILLPPYATATNSLLLQKNSNSQTIEEKLYYVGVINSFVLDFVLRQLITRNVNLTYLNQLPVIEYVENDKFSKKISSLSAYLHLLNGDMYEDIITDKISDYSKWSKEELFGELNAEVALKYGLSREDVVELLKTFNLVPFEEKQFVIEAYDKLTIEAYESLTEVN